MRHWRMLPLPAAILVIACGGRIAPDEAVPDAGMNVLEGGASCTSCQSNEDCQNACAPSGETGTACCDVGSATCFFTKDSACPAAVEEAGAQMSEPNGPLI
jgi:hypothetical protein